MSDKIITRIAPSPTGNLHIGTARASLFNFLHARKTGGKFLIRIEDTDKERSTKEFEQNILKGLEWLGLKHDDEIVRQSERTQIYSKYINQLIEDDLAYISKEEPKEEGQRSEVVRFRNPNKIVTFTDTLRGEISFDTGELNDFVIARDENDPLYHLAVVIDDFEMGVNHIIRGEDGLSNTARQILIQEAIGAPRPKYTHMPFVLGDDRKKLSKRHAATSLDEYKKMGYLPEALINFLALLGWNPGTEQEIFTLEELVEQFDIDKIQKGAGVFNIEKLNWTNKEHIKKLPIDTQMKEIISYVPDRVKKLPQYSEKRLEEALPDIIDRISVYQDVQKMFEAGDLDYFFDTPKYDFELLEKKAKATKEEIRTHLEKIVELTEHLKEDNHPDKVREVLWDYASDVGRASVFWPMRVAFSGKEFSADPFTIFSVIGKEESIKRIKEAIENVS